MLFLGKLLKGVVYVKDQISLYIARKRGYSYLSNDEINGLPNRRPNNSWFTKIKEWIFGKERRPHIPLYETRHSYANLGMSSEFQDRNSYRDGAQSPRSSRADLEFEHHMNNMMNSNYESAEFNLHRNLRSSSIYPPPQHRRTQSQPSIKSSKYESEITIPSSPPSPISPQNQNTFNVDSNMLFNSQFITKILHPFSSENQTEKDDNKEELEKALLSSEHEFN